MPNFDRSPSLPVEKIANAFILTLLIEMTVGVGLQRIERGGLCGRAAALSCGAVLRSSRRFSLSCLRYSWAGLLLRGKHPRRRQQNVEARSQTPRGHCIGLRAFPCADKL